MQNTQHQMEYAQAQRFVPSPREIIEHLCSQDATEVLTAEQITQAAEDIRQIAVMQVCTGISHSELQYIVEMATEMHFNAQSRTKWARALDALRNQFHALTSPAKAA